MLKKLNAIMRQRAEETGTRMYLFAIFGLLAYLPYYIINRSLIGPNKFDSFWLRASIALFCLLLLLKDYWPSILKKYLPIYWYFTIGYTMPFFLTYMALMNHGATAWVMNLIAILILTMLLVDWFSYAIITIVSIISAYCLFMLTSHEVFTYIPGVIGYKDIINTLIPSIIMGIIFSYDKEKIEKAIRHYFERIIVSMPGNVFWVDRNSTILGCNENMARMFNRKCSDMIGKNYEELILSIGVDIKEYEIVKQQDKEVMTNRKAMLNVEQVIFDSKNNKKTHFLTSRVPLLDDKKNIVGVLGISIDITKEKQAEKAKDDFISNMEHDLRTPFSGIGGIADMLYHKVTDPEIKKLLEIMVNSCNQWEQIHHRIFDAVILENESPLALESFYIKDELDKVANMMMATLHVKNLQLIIDCPPAEEIGKIYTDPIKIHLILLSLIGNAIKFTEQGSITVKARRIANQLEITIKDTGIGIPTDKLDYIFEKFAKIERSNQYGNKFQGAGLGLYISRKYAGLIGGHISVKSTVDVGSEFILSLPS